MTYLSEMKSTEMFYISQIKFEQKSLCVSCLCFKSLVHLCEVYSFVLLKVINPTSWTTLYSLLALACWMDNLIGWLRTPGLLTGVMMVTCWSHKRITTAEWPLHRHLLWYKLRCCHLKYLLPPLKQPDPTQQRKWLLYKSVEFFVFTSIGT